jgi:hypothetical protein
MKKNFEITPTARDALVRSAKRLGLTPEDAQDKVQDALLLAYRKQAIDPASFAGAALKNFARRAARKVPSIPALEGPGVESVLATAENVARLDAALEQVLVWSGLFGGGTTGIVVVKSLTDFDVFRVLVEFQAVLEAIDLLPFSPRHRRRLRRRFETVIAAAWKECEVSVDSGLAERERRREESDEQDEGEEQDEEEIEGDVASGVWVPVLYFENGVLERAFTVIRRAAPKLSTEESIELAAEAVRRAVAHVAGESC